MDHPEDWLKIVKTSHARSKIRTFLNEKEAVNRKEMVSKGEAHFKEELKKRGIDEKDFFANKRLESSLNMFAVKNMDDFYHAIAVKSLSVAVVFEKLNMQKRSLLDGFNLDRIFRPQTKRKSISKSGITVNGIDGIQIALSRLLFTLFLVMKLLDISQKVKVLKSIAKTA